MTNPSLKSACSGHHCPRQVGKSGQASAADGKRKPSADATGDGEPPAKKAAKPKGKAAAKATTGGTARTTTTPRKGGKVESLATNIASAKKTKAAYAEVKTSAILTLQQYASDKRWERLRKTGLDEPVKEALKKLDTVVATNTFFSDAVSHDIVSLKKKHGVNEFMVLLGQFTSDMGGPIDALRVEIGGLLASQEALVTATAAKAAATAAA